MVYGANSNEARGRAQVKPRDPKQEEGRYWRIWLEGVSQAEIPKPTKGLKLLACWPLEVGRLGLELWGSETLIRDYWQALPQEARLSYEEIPLPGFLTRLTHSGLSLCWGAKALPESIVLRPSGAFGSGCHPTTTLALEMLDTFYAQGVRFRRVLDLGAGSGILALVAARLGAEQVLAVELDPTACQVCLKNVVLNHLAGRVQVVCGTSATVAGPFDLILANLYLRVLLQEATHIEPLIAPQGLFLCTGFLAESGQALRQKYKNLTLLAQKHFEGWQVLLFKKSRVPSKNPK